MALNEQTVGYVDGCAGSVGNPEESVERMTWDVLLVAGVAAGLPTLAYLAFVWWIDRYEKEPLHLLAVTFLWGALPAALLAVTLEVTLDVPLRLLGDPVEEWRRARILAPVVEEIVKGAALVGLASRYRREFNGILDGIIYGAFVGLGFALTENFFAFVAAFSEGGASPGLVVVPLRTVLFGLNHPLYSALFGAGLGWSRYRSPGLVRAVVPGGCLLTAMGFHLAHNALVADQWQAWWAVPLAILADWSGLALLAALVMLAWAHERRWIEEGLRWEVALGTVTPGEYQLVISHRRRAAARWKALRQSGWPQYRAMAGHIEALTELAFAHYHLLHPRRQHDHTRELEALRAAVCRSRLALLGPEASSPDEGDDDGGQPGQQPRREEHQPSRR